MLPLPTAEQVLSSTTPTANSVFNAFQQYAWLEIGVITAVAIILWMIFVFSGGLEKLLNLGSSPEERAWMKRWKAKHGNDEY